MTTGGCVGENCSGGVSWIDQSDGLGYCEKCAQASDKATKDNLRHIYYGVPFAAAVQHHPDCMCNQCTYGYTHPGEY